MKHTILKWLLNLYPPYLGAGIRIKHIAKDFSRIDVQMTLRFWNKNYVGTHFGGSIYSMTDPFLMLMLIQRLGSQYIVWDKSALIRFKRPGKSTLFVTFDISQAQLDDIKNAADTSYKVEPVFHVFVLDAQRNHIAEVEKTLYVKKKGPSSPVGHSKDYG